METTKDAGQAVRASLLPCLQNLVDRYCAEHYDGQPLPTSHERALADDPTSQLEDFIYYMTRQPELVWVVDGEIYGMKRPVTVKYDNETGAETPEF